MNYDGVYEKLQEYLDLMDFNDYYFRSDFKNNYKFIKSGVSKFVKQKMDSEEIISFIQVTIDNHCKFYK